MLIFFSSEIAVNQLDQLNPEEQSLVKCAAVIGHSFHIDLLQHLLPGWSENKLLEVLKDLVDIHVLRWCSKGQELPAETMLVPSSVETEHTKEKTKSGELVPCSQAQIALGEDVFVQKEHQYYVSWAPVS